MKSTDALGQALKDYHYQSDFVDITVISDITDNDVIPTKYLFRSYDEMPPIEQQALELCKGKTLDIGAASGCHSLYLQKKGINVTAIDISEGAIEVMKNRGVQSVLLEDFYQLKHQKFDTLLLLMNGIGIAESLNNLPRFLEQCKKLLTLEGQVLLDSSDIKYLFEEEDGSMWINTKKDYYGEVTYQMKYNDHLSNEFKWLFIDFETLKDTAESLGFKIEKIFDGDHFDYLARLTL